MRGADSVTLQWWDKQRERVYRSGLPLVGELTLSLSEVGFVLDGEIYVLYQDGSYETYEDTWQEGESIPGDETPPAGFLEPVRGFGKLWAAEPGVRQKLGWATASEFGYTMLLETVQEYFGRYPVTDIYLTWPDQQVVHLYGFPTNWEIWP